jgi:aminoglycoside phosphotransferase (APT) family kinase protein
MAQAVPEGTIEVLEQHRFDEKKLFDYLNENVEGFEGPLEVRQFDGGQSNPTYMLVTPKKLYVLRRKPPGILLKSAHAVDREFRVISALNQTDFPVPRAYVLCEDEDITGTIFYVMDYVPGRVFWDGWMEALTPEERAAAYDSMNETVAKLHAIDHKAIGLSDYGREGNYFSRQISRWSKQYKLSETQKIEEMDKLIEWLPANVPPGDTTKLIHGDIALHNIMFHPTEPRVVAVLDWELSTTGDPIGDITYNTMGWYAPIIEPSVRPSYRTLDLKALGIPEFDDYVAKYCERAGRGPIENIAFYKAYNLFRSAAIAQGIVGRARDGTARDPNAADTEDRIPPMAVAAWAEAKEAGAV